MTDEISQKTDKLRIYVAVPTTGVVADMQAFFWREAEAKYADRIEFIWPKSCVRRIFHDYARNAMVEDFLASTADVLFFLDSDVVPPTDIFDLALAEKWDLCGAPYPVFMTPSGFKHPQVTFTVYRRGSKGLYAADLPNEGREEVEGLATGCLFIKRHVFDKLAKPYFEFKYDAETRAMTSGEDLGFCHKVNELGYKFLVDYSMVAKHYKSVCLLEVNNYAMEYAKRSVATYDGMIKGQVGALIARLGKKPEPAVNRAGLSYPAAPFPAPKISSSHAKLWRPGDVKT